MSTLTVKYPVFIPTKGRAETAALPKVLQEGGLPFTLVVEPQDEAAYREYWSEVGLLVLPENDRGIAYSREWLLAHTRAAGIQRYWQIDDNIRGFGAVANRTVTTVPPAEALGGAEKLVRNLGNVALVGLDYQQYGWGARRQYTLNRRTYCCVLTETGTGIQYRDVPLKEDVDFCLQHLAAGFVTVLVHRYVMYKPTMAAIVGGNAEAYRQGLDLRGVHRLIELWPQLGLRLVRKRRRWDVAVPWCRFTQQPSIRGGVV